MTQRELIRKKYSSHLDAKVGKILELLNHKECVALVGMHKSGINHVIDHVVYKLNSSSEFQVIYDNENLLSINDIKLRISKASSKQVLVVLPFAGKKEESYLKDFQRLFLRILDTRVTSLIHLPSEFIDSPVSYFSISVRPIENVDVILPYSKQDTFYVINQLANVYGYKVPIEYYEEIYSLSGGNAGLIKRICGYISKNKKLDISKLLHYPSIVFVLENLKQEFDSLSFEARRDLGFYNSKGKFFSELFEKYVQKGGKSIVGKLTRNEQKVFELFLDKKETIVSFDDIAKKFEDEEYSYWGTYKLISRLKKKIAHIFYLRNVKGKGYILRDKI